MTSCKWILILMVGLLVFTGCGGDDEEEENADTGTLVFTMNGEDFIRNGFITEDGWSMSFEHVYLTIQGPTAFQVADETEGTTHKLLHAGHPHVDIPDGAANEALLGSYMQDLTQGTDALPIGTVQAAAIGNYNYMNFNVVQASDETNGVVEDAKGYSVVLIGSAEKGSETVNFTIKLTEEMNYVSCGPHPENIGIVAKGGQGQAQATFHFDHIFGDIDDTEGEINDMAIGFEPFATLASEGTLNVTQTDLETMTEYDAFYEALITLGHFGEAHCGIEGEE